MRYATETINMRSTPTAQLLDQAREHGRLEMLARRELKRREQLLERAREIEQMDARGPRQMGAS